MILLLDLDGTLIDDRGYRAAIDATVNEICWRRGLPSFPPSDEDVHVLHAHGFSNEWDSVAFLVGILHLECRRGSRERPDYQAWTRKTAGLAGLPNERARDVLLAEAPAELEPLLRELLDHVTDVGRSEVTRTFAEHILGSHLFARHYGLAPELNTPSYLARFDRSLVDEAGVRIIRACDSCIYTARPSLSPDGHPPAHPPEAEIGLELLGLQDLPLIALGQIQWLADRHGERLYDLTKPAPVQALAAMLASQGARDVDAASAAYDLWRRGRLSPLFARLRGRRVFVAEDNAGGVRACHGAAQALNEHGIDVHIHGLGIAAAPAKRAALAPVCQGLFADINQALAMIPAPL